MREELLKKIADLKSRAEEELQSASDAAAVENCRRRYLGKKGEVTSVLKLLGGLDPETRPLVGREINILKSQLENEISKLSKELGQRRQEKEIEGKRVDVTLAGRKIPRGHLHPVRQTTEEIVDIFGSMGFSVYTGPEIETDYYNFEALNVPKDHPARDMQDTFYVEGGKLLRTHTSPVQIHVMKKKRPPIYAVFPGAVYRRDSDITHSPMFHQVEGLAVDARVTMGDLKGVLSTFCRKMFGGKLGVRFRPSFFPFTEPSAEVDISCVMCGPSTGSGRGGKGCRVCKGTGWLEILGCGMVDPAVFSACDVDSKKFSGFAFGMGVERIAMLMHAMGDIRIFFENDMRFLEQF